MPIYMDFHELPDGVTSAHVAEMHQADLKIEHKYNCRGLTYWCDEKRQTAFCLIEAPNEQSIIDLHKKAHGDVPQRIIEVNDSIVESFLGRIEDPEKSQNTKLNIINDPAFRTLMVVTIKKNSLRTRGHETLDAAIRGYNKSITNIIRKHKGRIVREKSNTYLMSFDSVTNAIKSALKIEEIYNCVITPDLQFKIGICAGVPVTQKDSIFEDTIARGHYLSYITDEKITISKEVKDLYESENRHKSVVENSFNSLQEEDLNFIIQLMEYTESAWSHSDISVSDFHENLGYSKSKLYRTMMSLIGKSPKSFLKEYRLQKALELLEINSALHISEIAYKTGFSSPNYFSKCFKEVYGILPSKYK